jgi:hemolysin III
MSVPRPAHPETPAEEVASSITHALGGLLAVAALTLLVVFAVHAGDPRRVVSVSVYGATLVFMYVASTAYHLVRPPRAKRVMRILDHASIYLLIAGTYTPVTLVTLRGGWGWSLFGVTWGLAVAGVVLKAFFIDRHELLSTVLYVAMGWVVLVAVKPLLASLPIGGVGWLVGGGVAYTAGVAFFVWDLLPFNHAIWHLFVLAGSICHFFCVLLYVLPG